MNFESRSKILLVVGCARSGTTLLASMLGRHSEINMLFESVTKDTIRLIGKKYSGNKLLSYRQLRLKSRSSKFGHLINRLVNLDLKKKHRLHKRRPFPIAAMSLEDYMEHNPTMVVIRRGKEETVNSITNRTTISRKQAEKEWERSNEIIEHMVKHGAYVVQFDELVEQPQETMKGLCKYLELEYEERMMEGPEYNIVYPNTSVMSERSSNAQGS